MAEDSPRDVIAQGNKHFMAGRYDEALKAYDSIKDDADPRILPELLHDRAAAHYKLGQLDEARELWVRAAGQKDPKFEALARYNLGNCDYTEALGRLQPTGDDQKFDLNPALDLLQHAKANYRDALNLDPDLANARANLELAEQLRRKVEQASQQQPQSQPSQDDQQNQDQQQDQKQDQQQQGDQSQSSDQQNQDQQDKEQQNPNDQDQQQDSQDQQQSDPQDQEQQQPESQPSGDQADPQEQQAENQPAQQPEQTEGQEPEQQQAQPLNLSRAEAEQLLQKIRDLEQRRRAYLRQMEARNQKPVDKDW